MLPLYLYVRSDVRLVMPSPATHRPGDTNNSLDNIYSLDAIGTDSCQKELLREAMLALRISAELLRTMVVKVYIGNGVGQQNVIIPALAFILFDEAI